MHTLLLKASHVHGIVHLSHRQAAVARVALRDQKHGRGPTGTGTDTACAHTPTHPHIARTHIPTDTQMHIRCGTRPEDA